MPDTAAHALALRERLGHLMKEHSQAEIARRCDSSPVNVHNYARGTRIPAEFCCALAERFQVNPAWLLLGEGAPYLTQGSAETSRATLNLLELVKSMNAAMRMRLGALVGKDYAKALRDLNEQLKSYLGLKQKVNAFFLPQYRRLVDDIEAAIRKSDTVAAGRFIEAALSVTTLCEDEELGGRLLASRALHSWLRGDVERMLELQGEAYMRSFASLNIPEDTRFYRATAYIASLQSAGYWRRAHSVARATLNLIPRAQAHGSAVLTALLAESSYELGNIRGALRHAARLDPAQYFKQGPFNARTLALWASGLAGCEALIAAAEKDARLEDNHRLILLTLALFSENAGVLERACRTLLAKIDPGRITGVAYSHVLAPLLLRAVNGERGKALLREFDRRVDDSPRPDVRQRWAPVFHAILRAQLARACGNQPELIEGVAKGQQLLQGMPEGVMPRLLVAAIHCRNALAAAGHASGEAQNACAAAAASQLPRLRRAAKKGAVVFAEFATQKGK